MGNLYYEPSLSIVSRAVRPSDVYIFPVQNIDKFCFLGNFTG